MTLAGTELLLIDTSVLVHVARRDQMGQHLLSKYLLEEREERPLFSTISEGEALGLSRRWNWGEPKLDRLRRYFSELVRVEAGWVQVVEAYAELHAASLTQGLNIGENDMWIAACAKATGAVILTCDSDFLRVPNDFARVEHVARPGG